MNSTKSIAALFDFDGVVMDTETQYSIFWNEQGRKYHPELPEFGRLIKRTDLDTDLCQLFCRNGRGTA